MRYRTRTFYTEKQRALMWERYLLGDTLHDIGRMFDRHHASIRTIIERTGGIRPLPRKRATIALSNVEREEISRGLSSQLSIREIARHLKRAPSSISREIKRNGGLRNYRATHADQAAWERAKRPKSCKLILNKDLAHVVAQKLKRHWSPEQIAGWLGRTYSDEEMHVSHETIYKTLYIQTRGALKKELQQYLRTKRAMRRSRHATLKNKGLGKIVDAIPISERPAEVEDRAIPGHCEGDLIQGSKNSFIATLVERHSRYVMLAKVTDKRTATVIKALIKQAKKLPTELYKTLTWDRGSELTNHKDFTIATNI